MKPRTVYEKAVQDFTQTARLQATLYRTVVLNQEKSRPLDHDVDANE
jgi:hypothetical protein